MFHLLVNKVKDTNYYLYCIINVAMYITKPILIITPQPPITIILACLLALTITEWVPMVIQRILFLKAVL